MSERFIVRQLSSAAEVKQIILRRAASLEWKPGALDHEGYFSLDKTGFFVGELDGQVISCMSAVKYSSDYAFLGNYIVDEPYRSRGFGLATWKAVLASLPEGCSSGLDAVEEMVKKYTKFGYSPRWKIKRMTFVASKALQCLLHMQLPAGIATLPASEVPFSDLLEYDTSVHIHPRKSFLHMWISAPNSHHNGYVAIDNVCGAVLGFGVVRKALRPEDGWRIGPLYADNPQIAKLLYRAILKNVSAENPAGVVLIDTPYGEALEVARQLPSEEHATYVRMFTEEISSKLPPRKLYGLTL